MTILGIETATSVCGASLAVDGAVRATAEIDIPYAHAEQLMALIRRVLGEGRLQLPELDGIAVSIGPGSFTGLRVGLSAAKGLAFALAKPLLAVPTLDALARRVTGAREGATLVPLIDARRDEVYCRSYRFTGGGPVPDGAVRDVTVNALPAIAAGPETIVTGPAAVRLQGLAGVRMAPERERSCSAGIIAIMGEELLRAGEQSDPRTLEPHYIKEFFIKAR